MLVKLLASSSSRHAIKTALCRKVHHQVTPAMTKIDSPEFQSILTPELSVLSQLFKNHGYQLRIAGGAVRDLLMGKCPSDVDLATTATPTQMKAMFEAESIRMINNQGEKHGTITARINDKENYEVTTLRIDRVTDGRHAEVEFTQDWHLDANRRDLTINSMFLGLDGTVYDYFNGQEDLRAKRVRFVGDAAQRIQEDYLRILRYFRFYGRIATDANSHEDETLSSIRENVAGLERISGERIWSEWKKILAGKFGGELTASMIGAGLGPYIGLPAEPDEEELSRVWGRCGGGGPASLQPPSLLAALLRTEEDVVEIHKRLKLSGYERDLCHFVVNNRHDMLHPVPIRPYQFLAVDARTKPRDTREYIEEVLKYRGQLDLLKEFHAWETPRFPMTGNHLKEAGCPAGRIMSVVIGKVKDRWKESDFELELDDLLKMIPEVLDSVDVSEVDNAKKEKRKKM